MTEPTEAAAPDLAFPPNPFNHGPCKYAKKADGTPGCPYPAVVDGGPCAYHAATLGAVLAAQKRKVDAAKRAAQERRTAARTAKRKTGDASRRKNRR